MVIGSISAAPGDILGTITGNLGAIPALEPASLVLLLTPILSLGVLLSMATLKTCVVLDGLTGSRHNSTRELFGQGVANIANSILGGVPGAGTMGGTLVNIYSGGRTRMSGVIEGVSSLAVLLLLARFVAWIPVASLAGVLLVVGVRMVDRKSFQLLKSRSTVFDFLVILAVVISAVTTSLITAAGVGIALAIVLFLRDQIRFPVVRRLVFGNRIFSRKSRAPSEQEVLVERGSQVLLAELQGQLFFGTTDQLYTMIEPNIGSCRYFIFDMRRVLAVDFTAANMLSQLRRKITERGGQLAFASVPRSLPTGQNVRSYLEKLGFTEHESHVRFFPDEDEALEWAEDALITEYMPDRARRQALDLYEFDFSRA
jgi:SulP family sulfate permease